MYLVRKRQQIYLSVVYSVELQTLSFIDLCLCRCMLLTQNTFVIKLFVYDYMLKSNTVCLFLRLSYIKYQASPWFEARLIDKFGRLLYNVPQNTV